MYGFFYSDYPYLDEKALEAIGNELGCFICIDPKLLKSSNR
jgi:hypothetical protein